jgi:hypothetical protein
MEFREIRKLTRNRKLSGDNRAGYLKIMLFSRDTEQQLECFKFKRIALFYEAIFFIPRCLNEGGSYSQNLFRWSDILPFSDNRKSAICSGSRTTRIYCH